MKKDKLIELLSSIEGNPEIVMWNGFVGDYMHISPKFVEDKLVKKTLAGYLEDCWLSECRDRNDWNYKLTDDLRGQLTSQYRKYNKWEQNQYITKEDINSNRYTAKRVVYIQPKLRGETCFDRNGNLSY